MSNRAAYITCIKNESDMIYDNLLYYYNLGIRDFYIMFNGSDIETIDRVNIFFSDHPGSIFIRFTDDNPEYKQPERFTMMSETAYRAGCNWIIPVDTDEILTIRGIDNIYNYIDQFDNAQYGYVKFRWYDYHPGGGNTGNIFIDWNRKEVEPRKESKIIVKWKQGFKFGDGHHLLTTKTECLAESKIGHFAHFPNRSKEQLEKKLLIIGRAFIEHFGENSERPQIKNYKELLYNKNYMDNLWHIIELNRKTVKTETNQLNVNFFS